jgi:glycosyltransferase involved in cell wall biosynthesis
MHVLVFNRSFYPDISATGQLLTDLCEDLVREHNCRVTVITGPALRPSIEAAPGDGQAAMREAYRGIDIHRVRGTRFDKARFSGRALNYVSYFLGACGAGLRVARPDVVVALTDPPIIGLAASLAARRASAPLVMVFQDLFPEVTALLPDFRSGTVDWTLQTISRFLCRRATRIVALGETMRHRLIENKGAEPDKIDIIENWADTESLRPGSKRNAFSVTHDLADKFVVMHSGNLGLSQNLEILVDAAAALRDLPDLVVVFQGEGVKKIELQQRAAAAGLSNVRFLPYVEREGLADSFAAADVFVISLQRGLAGYIVPSKLYGILAAGRPYVAAVESDCEVTALTSRTQCGVLAEPGDAADLARAIRALHGDRARLESLGQRAREAALSFDRRLQVDKYAHVLRLAVRSHGCAPNPGPAPA